MEGIRIETFAEPTIAFAEIAQRIGFEAWRDRFPERSESEIRHMFNPDSSQKAQQLLAYMEQKASFGRFVGAMAFHSEVEKATEDLIGYAWAADDMSGGWPTRAVKKIRRQRPYAWLAQLNVVPEMQSRGIGSRLASAAFSLFDGDQKPTTYVFAENPKTMRWFMTQGFAVAGDSVQMAYFGEDEGIAPVQQQRLQGYRVAQVIERFRMPRHG